jgi:hypothetical protein
MLTKDIIQVLGHVSCDIRCHRFVRAALADAGVIPELHRHYPEGTTYEIAVGASGVAPSHVVNRFCSRKRRILLPSEVLLHSAAYQVFKSKFKAGQTAVSFRF